MINLEYKDGALARSGIDEDALAALRVGDGIAPELAQNAVHVGNTEDDRPRPEASIAGRRGPKDAPKAVSSRSITSQLFARANEPSLSKLGNLLPDSRQQKIREIGGIWG